MNISVNKCPEHSAYAISIDDENGVGSRITPSKCCGKWETVFSWPVTPAMIQRMFEAEGKAGDPPPKSLHVVGLDGHELLHLDENDGPVVIWTTSDEGVVRYGLHPVVELAQMLGPQLTRALIPTPQEDGE